MQGEGNIFFKSGNTALCSLCDKFTFFPPFKMPYATKRRANTEKMLKQQAMIYIFELDLDQYDNNNSNDNNNDGFIAVFPQSSSTSAK